MIPGTRVIVAQAPLGPRGAREPLVPERHARLAVGLVRGNRFNTVVVRLTMTYELAPGENTCVAKLEAHGAALEEEDLVDFKPAADIMLVGHAYAEQALEKIAAGIAVGELDKKVLVSGPSARDAMELPEALGPQATKGVAVSDVEVAELEIRYPEGDWWNELTRSEPMRPDTGVSQADPTQRGTWLSGDETLNLWGLTFGGGSAQVALPGLRPVGRFETAFGAYMLVAFCDTLLLDTDARTIVTTWRAHVPVLDSPLELTRIVLSLEKIGEERDLDEILRDLPHGLFYRAIEPGDELDPSENGDMTMAMMDDGELRAARCATWTELPDPLLSRAQYERVRAELRKQPGKRREILQGVHMDEDDWTLEERHWAIAEAFS